MGAVKAKARVYRSMDELPEVVEHSKYVIGGHRGGCPRACWEGGASLPAPQEQGVHREVWQQGLI